MANRIIHIIGVGVLMFSATDASTTPTVVQGTDVVIVQSFDDFQYEVIQSTGYELSEMLKLSKAIVEKPEAEMPLMAYVVGVSEPVSFIDTPEGVPHCRGPPQLPDT